MKEKFNLKYLLFILWIVLALGTSFVAFNGKSPKEEKVIPRVYAGPYKGHIADKYPEANEKGDKVRKEILANIKTKKVHTEKNHRITECFDSKNRLIYKIDANLAQRTVTMSGNKFHKKSIELDVPEEEGYIYDNNDKVIIRLHRPNLWTYSVDKESEVGKYTYLEQGGIGVLVTDIKYFENNKRIETEEYINRVMSQLYTRTEKEFVDDKLVSEKEFVDQELDDSFIMYSTEKKYNEKNELIYKTVERKDKTNDYKSFTEMDFKKDEIVTKYYKGKDVFATVTETLVGPVETIEETEMDRGKEIKKVYKNKVKAIVKRQKTGEPVKIVDVIEYDKKSITSDKDSDKLLTIRYIFDNKGILKYKIIGNKHIQYSYLYDDYVSSKINDFNYYYTNDSFFNLNKKDEMFVYLTRFKSIEKINDKTIDIITVLEKSINEEYDNISIGEINESNYNIIDSKENTKKITLEELLNGYQYE